MLDSYKVSLKEKKVLQLEAEWRWRNVHNFWALGIEVPAENTRLRSPGKEFVRMLSPQKLSTRNSIISVSLFHHYACARREKRKYTIPKDLAERKSRPANTIKTVERELFASPRGEYKHYFHSNSIVGDFRELLADSGVAQASRRKLNLSRRV